MLTDKKISVVIVCYNDAGSVREMYRRVTEVMKQITSNYEIVYVNDKSPDNALDILREIAIHDKRIVVISHSRNFGGQAAYASGLRYATGDAIITLDGDIQDPPELFPELVKRWLEGNNVVYGIREKRKEGNAIRGFFYKAFYRIFRKLSHIMPLDASDFALMDREALDVLNSMPEVDRYMRAMRAFVGFKSIGIPYTHMERFAGTTNFSFFGYVRFAKGLIFSFSKRPIEWVFHCALFVGALSALSILFYILFAIFIAIPSLALTILVTVLFLGAIQIFSLSILAEYLLRTFDETKHRPSAIIDEIINDYQNYKEKTRNGTNV